MKKTMTMAAIAAMVLTAAPAQASDYNAEHCRLVAGTLNVHWEAVGGFSAPLHCTAIDFTDWTPGDAADGTVSMTVLYVSNPDCTGGTSYTLALSADKTQLTGSDNFGDLPLTLTRGPGEDCFVGHWVAGDDDYVLHVAAGPFGIFSVCGDVNDSAKVTSTDALLVLKRAVGQEVPLQCSFCGNGTIDSGETCEPGLDTQETCTTQGFAGGTLACGTGCTFDASGCYTTRYGASGPTIIDHLTGLEWEKKDAAGGGESICPAGPTCANPHDVDNRYEWSSTGSAPDGVAFTRLLGQLNGGDGAVCYAGHCDWRLPSLEELETTVSYACANPPCFGYSAFLPDAGAEYWSATTAVGYPMTSYGVNMFNGVSFIGTKNNDVFVRAVRSGS